MATRRERVVLELEDRFTAELGRAAAAAKMFDRELNNVKATAPGFTRTTVGIERDTKAVGNSIDRLSGRVAILARAGASLGPALVPITAAAVPALAGLTTQMGFAIAAAGSTVLAFQGVGDALEAMNKAQLDPSVANLRKAQQALEELSPAAFNFVLELREMGPAFKEVRSAAAEGLFPWLSDSLDEVESLLPRAASIVGEMTSTMGQLANASAEELAGPAWEDFFAFVEREARPTLTRLGASVGNVAKGVAEMWMAFDPLSDDFQDGLVSATQTFEDWAEGLSQTEGFAEFVRYIRETGPQVLDTIGSIANALLQVAEAAAPLGGPVLQILEAVADVVAAIADSDLGTPIFGAVAAMSALNLATTGWGKVKDTAFGARAVKQVDGFSTALLNVDSAQRRATLSVTEFARAEERRRATIAKGVGAVAAAGAGYAALEAGIIGSNTALGASVGMLAGPWGAAVGAGTGLMMDFASANDDAEAAIRGLDEALGGADFSALKVTSDQLEDEAGAFEDNARKLLAGAKLIPVAGTYIDAGGRKLFGGQREQIREAQDLAFEAEKAAERLAAAMGASTTTTGASGLMGDVLDGLGVSLSTTTVNAEEMARALRSAQPAMERLGITWQDLAEMDVDEQADAIARIRVEMLSMDSPAGRIETVAEAIADLDSELMTTEESAKALSDALSAILDPKIDLSRARDDWKGFLDDLGEELDTNIVKGHAVKDGPDVPDREVAGTRGLFGGKTEAEREGVRQNREVIRGGVEDIKELLVLAAENGAGPERLGKMFDGLVQGLIDTGVEAGLSKEEIRKFIRQLGLTPDVVEVLVKTEGVDDVEAEIDRLTRPRNLKITVKGVGPLNPLDPLIFGPGGRDGDPKTPFADGGYTGPGGKYEPAGIVHRAEYVFSSEATRGNEMFLDGLHRTLRGYAGGGYVGSIPSRAVVASPGAGIDYDRLAAAMLRARPLYGDVHISGDPSEFKRAMRQDQALAGSDGMRR